jgi:hypothetical protein
MTLSKTWLVVLTILKSMKVNEWEGLSHILCQIKAMFETTNQKNTG